MPRRTKNKSLGIQAENVRVVSSQPLVLPNLARRSGYRRRVARNAVNNDATPLGVNTGAGSQPKPRRVRNTFGRNAVVAGSRFDALSTLAKTNFTLSEHARSFVEKYIDPCGSHRFALDYSKVPDGAIPQSASPEFRFLDTIELPFQTQGTTELDGNTYSALFLTTPLFRILGLLIVNKNDREFDSVLMTSFCKTFNQAGSLSELAYPTFLPIPLPDDTEPTTWVTAFDTAALRSILPPNVMGASSSITNFRFTSLGARITFNTPTLVDQGTFAALRFPTDQSKQSWEAPQLLGFEPFYLHGIFSLAGVNLEVQGPNLGFPPIVLNPTVITLTNPIRNQSGSFSALPSDTVVMRIVSNRWILANDTTSQSLDLAGAPPAGVVATHRLYYNTDDLDEGNAITPLRTDLTTYTFPPVTQSAIQQADTSATSGKVKDWGGVYLPSVITEPVFNVAKAIAYGRIALATSDSVADDLLAGFDGISDTFDANFCTGVINFKSIPYANKFQVKLFRTDELVPATDSLIGAFSVKCPPREDKAIHVAYDIADEEPHGYPESYNGFGTLFSMVSKVLDTLPVLTSSVDNIAQCVNYARSAFRMDKQSPRPFLPMMPISVT